MTVIVDLDDFDFDYDDADEGFLFTPAPKNGNTNRTAIYTEERDLRKGKSSKSKEPEPVPGPGAVFLCQICFDPKPKSESFSVKGCSHSYCKDCMANYVRSKLQENVSHISCPVPNCCGLLEPHHCSSILPVEVFDRWGNALCEALVLGSQKFYCPYKDCSLMLVDDGGEAIRESECPNCNRLFCAQCKVPWHAEIECEEFQKLHNDEREMEDRMLMKLAQNKEWRRCPHCRIYVERIHGCTFMKCRCGTYFCYGCGTAKTSSANHHCACGKA